MSPIAYTVSNALPRDAAPVSKISSSPPTPHPDLRTEFRTAVILAAATVLYCAAACNSQSDISPSMESDERGGELSHLPDSCWSILEAAESLTVYEVVDPIQYPSDAAPPEALLSLSGWRVLNPKDPIRLGSKQKDNVLAALRAALARGLSEVKAHFNPTLAICAEADSERLELIIDPNEKLFFYCTTPPARGFATISTTPSALLEPERHRKR